MATYAVRRKHRADPKICAYIPCGDGLTGRKKAIEKLIALDELEDNFINTVVVYHPFDQTKWRVADSFSTRKAIEEARKEAEILDESFED